MHTTFKLKNVLITGASGPLGIMLLKECIKRGVKALAVVRPDSKNKKNLPVHPLVRVVECDISAVDKLPEQLNETIDTCFHLAWTNTGDEGRNNPILQEQNINYTLKTAVCAKQMGCKVFMGAGSQAEYGPINCIANEDSAEKPDTLYGIAKLAAGRLVMEYCKQNNIRCNWVRIFGVYGPYENDYIFTAYMIKTLLSGEVPILTPCEQIWDYLYCEDAIRALWLIAERAERSGIYCLGSGCARQLKEYVYILRDQINPQLRVKIGEKPYGEHQTMHLEADISKLTSDTGFVPQYTFEDGIANTIAWYKGESR